MRGRFHRSITAHKKHFVTCALAVYGGDRAKAARYMGVSLLTLRRYIKKYRIAKHRVTQ